MAKQKQSKANERSRRNGTPYASIIAKAADRKAKRFLKAETRLSERREAKKTEEREAVLSRTAAVAVHSKDNYGSRIVKVFPVKANLLLPAQKAAEEFICTSQRAVQVLSSQPVTFSITGGIIDTSGRYHPELDIA